MAEVKIDCGGPKEISLLIFLLMVFGGLGGGVGRPDCSVVRRKFFVSIHSLGTRSSLCMIFL